MAGPRAYMTDDGKDEVVGLGLVDLPTEVVVAGGSRVHYGGCRRGGHGR
jgi:hypothetical protein